MRRDPGGLYADPMKRATLSLPFLLVAAGILAGCSAPAEAEPTPTPTAVESANVASCEAFADFTMVMAETLNSDGNANDAWAEQRAAVDSAALDAEGDVKERLDSIVEDFPRAADLFVYVDARDAFNEEIEGVQRACDADDAPIEVALFQTS